ncbi:MAG: SURF1 family protein [Nitrococcus sp.]|nr:SURF1 family protein [Nitrococcus sp.]
MRISSYEFRPGIVSTLAVALVLPLLAALGVWQLNRAQAARDYLESVEAGHQAAPIHLDAGLPDYSKVHHRVAIARGRYDSAHQFLLDNQVHEARVGYHVLTPLRLAGSDAAVLVDRGWVPAAFDRSVLPDVTVSEKERRVSGIVDKGPSVGIRLGKTYIGAGDWPRRILYADFKYMAEALPYPIAPYLIRLDPQAPDGFISEPPTPAMGPARHLGYAVQWFALATAVAVIYLVVNAKRRSDDN